MVFVRIELVLLDAGDLHRPLNSLAYWDLWYLLSSALLNPGKGLYIGLWGRLWLRQCSLVYDLLRRSLQSRRRSVSVDDKGSS